MNREHELPADLDNLIAGLRIENINLKLAAKQAESLLKRATEICTFNTEDEVVLLDIQQFLASQQGEQCPQCSGSGTVSDSDGCGVWYVDCPSCAQKHPEQAEGAPCQGRNCGATDFKHSPECLLEAAITFGCDKADLREAAESVFSKIDAMGEQIGQLRKAEGAQGELAKDGDAIINRLRLSGLTIDGDNAYKRDLLDCVVGALAFGFQGRPAPDESHWLHRFWEIGSAEREARAALAQPSPAPELDRLIPDNIPRFVFAEGRMSQSGSGTWMRDSWLHLIQAQHDRIVGALRAERDVANVRADRFLRLLQEQKKITDKVASSSYAEGIDDAEHGKVGGKWRTRLFDEATNRANDLGYQGVLDALDDLKKTTQRLHEIAMACATAEQERDAAQAKLAAMERKLDEERDSHMTTIEQRDTAEQWADDLAKAISERFGVDIGEHSNLNCPWNEALNWIQADDTSQNPVERGYMLVPIDPTDAMLSAGESARQRKLADICSQTPTEFYEGGPAEACYRATLAAAPVAQAGQVPQAWLDVQAERRRQVEDEGWAPEHDDEHGGGQMARAAACYALAGSCSHNDETAALLVDLAWPWAPEWWKPTASRRDLVKSAALILAELERLDRAAAPAQGGE